MCSRSVQLLPGPAQRTGIRAKFSQSDLSPPSMRAAESARSRPVMHTEPLLGTPPLHAVSAVHVEKV